MGYPSVGTAALISFEFLLHTYLAQVVRKIRDKAGLSAFGPRACQPRYLRFPRLRCSCCGASKLATAISAGTDVRKPCVADRIFTSATSPSALRVENGAAQRDELHRWPAILFRPSGRSVPKTDRSPLPKSRYSSFAPSSGVTRASKAKHLSRFWVSSLCTPSARSDTSSYLSLLRISCGPDLCPRGPAHR